MDGDVTDSPAELSEERLLVAYRGECLKIGRALRLLRMAEEQEWTRARTVLEVRKALGASDERK